MTGIAKTALGIAALAAGFALSQWATQRVLEWQWRHRWPRLSVAPGDYWDTDFLDQHSWHQAWGDEEL